MMNLFDVIFWVMVTLDWYDLVDPHWYNYLLVAGLSLLVSFIGAMFKAYGES